ncbi:hypothetical protein [Kitasatospora sp. NPDC058190]|uniref:hypothetical protein n=1 Tax=Kitasatospora sp. NPDC058190 TaxID=3346371 RepID=UPI0036DD9427
MAWAAVPVPLAPLLPGGAVAVFVVLFAVGAGTPALRVMLDLLVFRQVPSRLRGRVIAATITLLTAGMPAGAFAAGLLPATASRTLRRAVRPAAAPGAAQG